MVTSTSQVPRAFDLAFCILTCSNLFRAFFWGHTFNCSGVVVEIIIQIGLLLTDLSQCQQPRISQRNLKSRSPVKPS